MGEMGTLVRTAQVPVRSRRQRPRAGGTYCDDGEGRLA